jgi:phosphoribosylaminoimidazolecarboxamide formyltransferase/IMP cyclohydrolase
VARALLSVSDKTGLVEFGQALVALGIELVASGGTAESLRQGGLRVVEVSELTGSAEMLGGRVKTLHPKVHGGILARRDLAEDQADLDLHGIDLIDLVVVNLYPFEATVAKPGTSREEAIEKIDIGGPSMIRSAAKNYAFTAVVVDPADYAGIVAELRAEGCTLSQATRERLAHKAFARTAAYDSAIHSYLSGGAAVQSEDDRLPTRLRLDLPRAGSLRYGENPHQHAALYGGFLDLVEALHGKELSFNNVVDAQAALALIGEFDPSESAACAILKHNTPCGAGLGKTPAEAYRHALATDPESPFGGVVVVNRAFDADLARAVDEIFTEVLIGPGFAPEALEFLRKKKNRRLLRFHPERIDRSELDWRKVYGGVLVQDPDLASDEMVHAQVVTARKPTDEERRALTFAWKVVKHVKSNAIVFAAADRTLALGGGATSRVDAVLAAREKAARVGHALAGSVLASDAYFPFPDGLEAGVTAGATAVVQPGGSVRDPEVIAAADRLGIAMLFTGVRHFRH